MIYRDIMSNNDINSVIILCGGMSRRMGQDKGSLLINKKPMIIHVIDSLTEKVDELIIVLNNKERISKYKSIVNKYLKNSEKNKSLKIKFVEDEIKDKGPLSGIMTGLKNISSQYGLVLPCDSPFISSFFIQNMFDILYQNLNININLNSNIDPNIDSNINSNIDSNFKIEGIVPYHNNFSNKYNENNKSNKSYENYESYESYKNDEKIYENNAKIIIDNKKKTIDNSEPLHSIYNKDISKKIENLLKKDEKQVKALIKIINSIFIPITEENNITESNFRNINYKKDIEKYKN